jgi:nucleoid-associated protein YgaU
MVALAWIDKLDEVDEDELDEDELCAEQAGRPMALLAPAGRPSPVAGPPEPGPYAAGMAPGPGARRAVEQRRLPRTFFWRRLVAVCALGAVGVLAWASVAQMFGAAGAPHGSQLYVARPGDTIWGIAEHFSGGGDPWPLVGKLEAEIGDGTLQPGQVLAVPAPLPRSQ